MSPELLTINNGTRPVFPFILEDLLYWVIRKKDGTVIKYSINDTNPIHHSGSAFPHTHAVSNNLQLAKWCKHDPTDDPIWGSKALDLYIADSAGTKAHYKGFDFVIDCGDTLPMTPDGHVATHYKDRVLGGDPTLTQKLEPFLHDHNMMVETHLLKINWEDREAPPVKPEFWPALAEQLYGMVLCSCQGGHGRSGTSLVCLLMVLNKDYSPMDAIIHLRALHCARAIESKTQHEYINLVAAHLGRPTNALQVANIKDYREAFLSLNIGSAKPYQDRLLKEKGNVIVSRPLDC